MKILDEIPTLATAYTQVLGQFALKNSAKALRLNSDQNVPAEPLHYRVPEVRIEPEKLTDYAKVFGTDLSDQVPMVLVHIMGFPLQIAAMADEAFPLTTLGMIHLKQDTSYHRPLSTGTAYQLDCVVDDYRQHKQGTTVTVSIKVSDQAGVLYEADSTYLAKGTQLGSSVVADQLDRVIDVNTLVPQQQWRLLADAGRQYARLSGDMNPIHLNKLAAKVFGLKGQLAHGMYLVGRSLAGREPRGANFRYRVDFFSPVLLPSSVSVNIKRGTQQQLIGFGSRSKKLHFVGELSTLESNDW